MANVIWTMKLYDLDGATVSANDMNVPPTSSEQIKHATNRNLHFYLNGIDDLNFTLYLDDPIAAQIRRLRNVVKVWRTVYNNLGVQIYADGANDPCFAGIVVNTVKDGDANTMTVQCFSPLWRLQTRFHLLNHYLSTNPDTAARYKQSELLWKLIDLVNGAFGGNSFTGIARGTFSGLSNDVTVAPFFVGKGTNTWVNFETVLDRPSSVDIIPKYYHNTTATTAYMRFFTDTKRGRDISASVDLRYNISPTDPLSNCVEEETPQPNEFANYLWAVGQGGPNSGKVVLDENINDDDDGYENIGIYMRRADFPDIKTIGSAGPPPTGLHAIAQSEFAQARVPKTSYTVTISPSANLYYGQDFVLGDVVMLNAAKGALSVTNVKQRIYDATLSMSDNNIETAQVLLANDFYGKVAT